jgi:hypothetical protein
LELVAVAVVLVEQRQTAIQVILYLLELFLVMVVQKEF